MEKIDMKKIAQEANVSMTLVSQVLNNRNIRVAEATRRRILDVASRYQYVPNRLAAALKLKRTNTIAILVPFTSVGFFSELIYHIESYALDRGYNTLVLNTFGDKKKEENALQFYRSQLADGFLVAAQNVETNRIILSQMKSDSIPLVFIDRFVDGIEAPTVSSDHVETAYELCRKLIDKGKKDIVFIRRVDDPENSTLRGRVAGYARAMESAGLAPDVLDFHFEGDEGSDLLERLASRPAPEAVFLHSGFYMPHLLKTCERLGYGIGAIDFGTVDGFLIPFDFSRAGELFEMMRGNITVAVQDTRGIARRAVDALIETMEAGSSVGPGSFIPVEWKEL
ncbi:MAG: LacI family transcriptional regulator [Spirochaetes bacterium]|nr:LacI family transcriptional regulator [Spirochaetota bacterium]